MVRSALRLLTYCFGRHLFINTFFFRSDLYENIICNLGHVKTRVQTARFKWLSKAETYTGFLVIVQLDAQILFKVFIYL